MKTEIEKLFLQFVENVSVGDDDILKAKYTQSSYDASFTKRPIYTVLIEGRSSNSYQPLAIVLLTVPSLSVDDPKILEFVIRRVRAHKAPYFITWNMRSATLWLTPSPGVYPARDSLEILRNYSDLYEISTDENQILNEPVKLKLLDRGRDFLFDLKRLLKDEALELVNIDATYFVGRLIDAVHRLLPMVSNSIHHRMQSDPVFRKDIEKWAVKQSIAGSPTDPEFSKSISRHIIYRLLGKVLFYKSLRRSARHLPKLDLKGFKSSHVLPFIRSAFAEALKIDYHAVFDEDMPDRLQWPSNASEELVSLINDFNTRNFDNLPQDVVGTVFERLIPPEERHALGQYFTSEILCDLIVGFCISSSRDTVFDPTCGTGTFLIRAYDRLRWLGEHNHAKLLSRLWGVDIAPFPAELATINLFRQRIAQHDNFPRIICKDLFKLSPGDRFPFPPPKMDMETPESIEEPIPMFDAIIGNFPYVNASQIDKHEAGYLEFIRKRLLDGWFEKYPQLFFKKNKKLQRQLEDLISRGIHINCERNDLCHRISTYADLYVYLFFHTTRFLNIGGRMGIITSNAWLDVNFGYELQRFFLNNFKIVAILESRCEPWFLEASVNTVITVVERCEDAEKRDANLVRFVKVKRPLTELIQGDPEIEAMLRWKHIAKLVGHIENSGIKYTNFFPMNIVTEEDENFRIRILRQEEMLADIKREGKTVKWGRYLRAPQIFFDIFSQGKLCTLSKIATASRGSQSGINKFYHLLPKRAEELVIEPEFLQPLLKSPGESKSIPIHKSQLTMRIFVCRLRKQELKAQGKNGALSYIEWGEKQVFKSGVQRGLTWPNGAEVRVRKPGWYAIPEHRSRPARVFFTQAFGDRHLHRYSSQDIIADARLYFLKPQPEIEDELLSALLNSSVCALSTEIFGRVTMGDGVLELKVEDANDYLLVPDLREASLDQKNAITYAFKRLCTREIGSVFDEVSKKDRKALDSAILDAIGLDPKKYLRPIYEGLCKLVRERFELCQIRGKARKVKARGVKAEKKTIEDVLDEILPQGLKRFPDDFYSSAAIERSKIAIDLPNAPLIFVDSALFKDVYVEDNSFKISVKSPAEGKFLVYAQKAGHKTAYLPKKIVELTRTVANYEKYLRELRKQLYEAFYRRTLDTKTASRLTQNTFKHFRLPNTEI